MGVWSFEAADITDSEDLQSHPIYRTPAIDAFLHSEKSEKRIISGLKGTGKTLFLKVISQHYRRLGGVTLIPKNQLTERLYSIDYDFSGDKAKAWASSERWKHVWRTVLFVLVLKAVGQKISPDLLTIFPSELGLSIGAHLSAAIRNRVVDNWRFQELFPKTLDSPIQAITQPVALFLDNIDEAMARHSGHDLYRNSIEPQRQLGSHSYEIWLSAQIGFVLALREITTRNAHLKLFGTVRGEAIRDNPTATAFNLQAMVLDLRYTPAELRGIFETKLRKLLADSPQSFPRRSEPNPIRAFFPLDRIEHPSVTAGEDHPYSEDIFDYLRRHTRGRPRELDFIGYGLQMIPPSLRTPERIRELVRDLSHQFFGFARNEAVPFWDPRLEKLVDKIPSNFILRRDAERIAETALGAETGRELWGALYANGLCGAVVNVYPSGMEQRFSKHGGVGELSELDFRSARIWVLHPCVNIATRPRRARYQANPRNVAGHAHPFVSEPRARKKHLHVLVGAGRLGLGLVVPMMLAEGGTKILIVARASNEWQPLLDSSGSKECTLAIRYFGKNGLKSSDYIVEMRVVSDKHTLWQEEIQKSLRRSRCVLLLSSASSSLQRAISLGDSIGISVGPKGLEAVATTIADTTCKAKVVLGYENDEVGMQNAAKILEAKGKTLVPTVVDRICSEREVGEETVVIRAERYGKITACVETTKLRLLPSAFFRKANDEVRAVTDAEEFRFVQQKKKRLVNSLHSAAAALVLKALMDVGARQETANDVLLGLVAQNMDIRAELLGVKELMILSVVGTLPPSRLDHKLPDLIRELNEYGEQALQRMLEGPDAPSRVLKTDVQSLSAKYRMLFADVQNLALEALRHKVVQATLQMTETEIKARLATLNNAFLTLLTKPGNRGRPGSDLSANDAFAAGAS